MADPFSIVGGVVGIISSLASLSMKINEFRRDAQGARAEMAELADEVQDLSLALEQLWAAHDQGVLAIGIPSASRASNGIGAVLQRLERTVTETSAFVRRCQESPMRGLHWAFTGKSQCLQFCRRLESHKSTVNITLALSGVIHSHGHQAQGDQLLRGIDRIRQQLAGTDDDIVLRRYLAEVETVYEGSTVAGDFDDPFADGQAQDALPAETPATSHDGPTERGDAPTQYTASPASPAPPPPPPPPYAPRLVDAWAAAAAETQCKLTIEDDDITTWTMRWSLIACRGSQFAFCCAGGSLDSYGKVFRGTVGQPGEHGSVKLWKTLLDPPPSPLGSDYGDRVVTALSFHDDGTLVAILRCYDRASKKNHHRLVAWQQRSPMTLEQCRRISPSLYPIGNRIALSRSGRHCACAETADSVSVYDLDNGVARLAVARVPHGAVIAGSVIWTADSQRLLIGHTTGTSLFSTATLGLYSAANGHCVAAVSVDELVIPGNMFPPIQIFALGTDGSVAVRTDRGDFPHPIGKHEFVACIYPTTTAKHYTRIEHPHHGAVEHISGPGVNSDGSCLLALATLSNGYEDLLIIDTESGRAVSQIPAWTGDRNQVG